MLATTDQHFDTLGICFYSVLVITVSDDVTFYNQF